MSTRVFEMRGFTHQFPNISSTESQNAPSSKPRRSWRTSCHSFPNENSSPTFASMPRFVTRSLSAALTRLSGIRMTEMRGQGKGCPEKYGSPGRTAQAMSFRTDLQASSAMNQAVRMFCEMSSSRTG